MKNIRTGVFETNSSSTHSVSISPATDGIYDTIVPDENGVIKLEGGEFGWEWAKYNDALTKANYAAVFSMGNEFMRQGLIELLKEHTGAKEVICDLSPNYSDPGYSYIDHQSAIYEGGQATKVFETKETLKDWLFSRTSWLFTGNDNESHPPNFYDPPGTVYTHSLSIEGSSRVESFKAAPSKDQLHDAIDRVIQTHPELNRNDVDYDHCFEFRPYAEETANGKEVSSFDREDEGIILLLKIDRIYTDDKQARFRGIKVIDTKEIKFTLKEIA